ncbi:MAG: hypothetical protein WAU82_15775, partial [Candidatus Binatus sp.]|uniref:hypothetical protein n=1 Tax=Candidatus Binatus sp. TaxID=2811406 RepID=UPI003BAF04E5
VLSHRYGQHSDHDTFIIATHDSASDKIPFRKTNFDGTKLPLVVFRPHHHYRQYRLPFSAPADAYNQPQFQSEAPANILPGA